MRGTFPLVEPGIGNSAIRYTALSASIKHQLLMILTCRYQMHLPRSGVRDPIPLVC